MLARPAEVPASLSDSPATPNVTELEPVHGLAHLVSRVSPSGTVPRGSLPKYYGKQVLGGSEATRKDSPSNVPPPTVTVYTSA